MFDTLWPHGLYSPWNSSGQNTGVGSLSLLQGIFLTQGSNRGLLHCRWILYQLGHQGSPNKDRPQERKTGPERTADRYHGLHSFTFQTCRAQRRALCGPSLHRHFCPTRLAGSKLRVGEQVREAGGGLTRESDGVTWGPHPRGRRALWSQSGL